MLQVVRTLNLIIKIQITKSKRQEGYDDITKVKDKRQHALFKNFMIKIN